MDGAHSFSFSYEKKPTGCIYLTPSEHTHTLLWLHGFTQSSDTFLHLFLTQTPMLPNSTTKIILMNAPKEPSSLLGGAPVNQWYDILDLKEGKVDEVSLEASTQRVLSVVHEEALLLREDYTKIFVGGFSQGCCLSFNVALKCPIRIGGLIGLSGTVLSVVI